MDLVDWQQRFERWILTHHAQDDAAHDLSHFRRVWATATQLAAGGGSRPAGTPHGLLFS
ncbi:metal-dependent phosphohydrolase [Klebsiella pneumoniae]|uniref:Metal-dependent phosphohydrolase n=1 Tax=Klebsiella pneumoniae TaxID=573 RepID=A0A377V3R4_KLEPN|nr:metal-dependent phosphohydrolase [Klebsiella pneumoniae]